MEQGHHYATVTEAINELKQQGFTIDFNLEENCIGYFRHIDPSVSE